MPITGAETALKTWYTAVVNNDGKAPDKNTTWSYGRKARDAGLGRAALTSTDNTANLTQVKSRPARGGGSISEPESVSAPSPPRPGWRQPLPNSNAINAVPRNARPRRWHRPTLHLNDGKGVGL